MPCWSSEAERSACACPPKLRASFRSSSARSVLSSVGNGASGSRLEMAACPAAMPRPDEPPPPLAGSFSLSPSSARSVPPAPRSASPAAAAALALSLASFSSAAFSTLCAASIPAERPVR